MDAIDRFFHQLVQTLRVSHPHLLAGSFEVSELYSTILPYRHHRRALGLETNQEYEMTLLQLLAGARGYLRVDERMRDALSQELAAPTPNPERFREFATARVSLAPDAAQRIEAAATASAAAPANPAAATRPVTASAYPTAAPTPQAPGEGRPTAIGTPRSATPAQPRGIVAAPGEKCRYCSGDLPPGRRVVFCPQCGQDLSIRNCPACGSELELGWRFCVTCGRSVASDTGS